ncbi:hypothetical protein K438DRAFT_1780163 [Mycena galopus ATCC 62051]|nr:hypothetical protein K438DRAFT_1789505 [Mycena galopus ATCC 62051]KAF8147377.1 hypothetical protein K438DRAFT_1780163 [Mycena galopus ATCC 62051]
MGTYDWRGDHCTYESAYCIVKSTCGGLTEGLGKWGAQRDHRGRDKRLWGVISNESLLEEEADQAGLEIVIKNRSKTAWGTAGLLIPKLTEVGWNIVKHPEDDQVGKTEHLIDQVRPKRRELYGADIEVTESKSRATAPQAESSSLEDGSKSEMCSAQAPVTSNAQSAAASRGYGFGANVTVPQSKSQSQIPLAASWRD